MCRPMPVSYTHLDVYKRQGKWADIVLFNYDEIEDTPTYENPKKACKGIRKVFVNGKLAASDGAVTNCKAGKILRK